MMSELPDGVLVDGADLDVADAHRFASPPVICQVGLHGATGQASRIATGGPILTFLVLVVSVVSGVPQCNSSLLAQAKVRAGVRPAGLRQ